MFALLLAIATFVSGVAGGSGQRWRCVDPDGTTSIEGPAQFNDCCARNSRVVVTAAGESIDVPTCHDVEIASAKTFMATDCASSVAHFAPELSPDFHSPLIDALTLVPGDPLPPETVCLSRDSPARLSMIVLLV